MKRYWNADRSRMVEIIPDVEGGARVEITRVDKIIVTGMQIFPKEKVHDQEYRYSPAEMETLILGMGYTKEEEKND